MPRGQVALARQCHSRTHRPRARRGVERVEARRAGQRLAQRGACERLVAGAGGDRAEVPGELRVDRAEAVRELRLGQRLAALPGRVERPRERVVAVDGGPERERLAGQRDDGGARHRAGMRGVEERRLEIGVAAGADEEGVLDADERVGLLRAGGVAARRAHVAELRDDVGQRQVRGRALVPALGLREVAARDGDGAEAGLGARVVREQRERVAELLGGRVGVARLEQERGQLHARPLRVLGRARARVDGAAHEPRRARDVALQLARVAEARIGDEAGAQVAEAREGGEALVVAAELDRGVADHRERRGREAVRERQCPLSEPQRLAEVVVGERQRAGADRGVDAAGIARERAIEQRRGLRVVRRVVRLACALQVGDAEIALEPRVGRVQLQPALELAHLRRVARQRRDRIQRRAYRAGRGLRGGGIVPTTQAGQQTARDSDRGDAEHECCSKCDCPQAALGHRSTPTCCPSWGC